MSHSRLPWSLNEVTTVDYVAGMDVWGKLIMRPGGMPVMQLVSAAGAASLRSRYEDDCELIIRAVNHHDELVRALRSLLGANAEEGTAEHDEYWDSHVEDHVDTGRPAKYYRQMAWDHARAVLAKVEGRVE